MSVEEDDIAVFEVALDDEGGLAGSRRGDGVSDGVAAGADPEIKSFAVGSDEIVGAGVEFRAVLDELFDFFDVPFGDHFGDGEDLGEIFRDADVVDPDIRVRRDDGAGGEVDPFAGEIGAEATFFAFQTLGEGAKGAAGSVPRGGDSGDLVVEVGGRVVLEEFPEVFNDKLRGSRVDVFAEALVDSNNVDEFMCEVIF